jgi:hypothetical protein
MMDSIVNLEKENKIRQLMKLNPKISRDKIRLELNISTQDVDRIYMKIRREL